MTGRDLIIYILSNNLEDEPVYNNGKLIGFMTAGEAAAKLNVGIPTVYALIQQGELDHILIGGMFYIPVTCELKLGGNDG